MESTTPKSTTTEIPASGSRRGRSSSWLTREKLDTIAEKGVLGCVLALIVYAPFAFGGVRNSDFAVMLGIGVLMMGFWAARMFTRTQYRFLLAPFGWVVLAFTGYVIWHYTRADIEYAARLELLRVLLYAAVFFAVLDNCSKQESIQVILFTLVGVAVINACYGIFQFFTDSRTVLGYPKPEAYLGRGSGTYVCPNHLAGLLEMALPIALAYTITGRLKPLTKIFIAYGAVLILAGIGVTISRAGYAAMAGALAVLFVSLLWNRDFRLPALGLLILLVAGGSFFGFRSTKSQLRFWKLDQANSRVLMWRGAAQMWRDHFWTGVGPNHYDWRFRQYRDWQAQKRPLYAHNDYLNTLADYGIIGGGIIAAGLGLLGWSVFRSWKYVRRTNEIATKPSNRAAALLGASVGLLAIALHSGADFNMHIPANALVAVLLMAVVTSHLRHATERFWVNPGWPGRILGVLMLAGGMSYFSMQAARLGTEAFYLRKASKLPPGSAEQVAALEKAHAIEPRNFDTPLRLGEFIRLKAWEGKEGYEELLREALAWFERGIEANPWDSQTYVKAGMCWHWLQEPEKAADCFDAALRMDPKSSYVLGFYGWHRLQLGDLQGARKYLAEGYSYNRERNVMAKKYLDFVERKLAESGQKP